MSTFSRRVVIFSIISILSTVLLPELSVKHAQAAYASNGNLTFYVTPLRTKKVDKPELPPKPPVAKVVAKVVQPKPKVTKPAVSAKAQLASRQGKVTAHGKIFTVTVTAYSSTVDQTDGNPFITASGSHVHWGTVAANFLPFGTKVRFPDYFGDKVFTIEDRTAARFSNRADIWFPSRGEALQFGKRTLRLEVL